jgi:hypothetical protein
VLNEKSLQAALTPVVLKTGEKPSMPYGYGLGLSKYRGVDVISHGGGLHGFVTQLAYYPKEKVSVVMFSNTAEPEVAFNPHAVAETYLWNKMESQNSYAEASVKPKDLQQYVGRYELSGIGVMHITTEENKLYAQLSGQPTFEIFPLAENEFFWKVVDARLKFFKNEKGEITQAIRLCWTIIQASINSTTVSLLFQKKETGFLRSLPISQSWNCFPFRKQSLSSKNSMQEYFL